MTFDLIKVVFMHLQYYFHFRFSRVCFLPAITTIIIEYSKSILSCASRQSTRKMASVQDDAPSAKMEDYLTCTICLETLKDPRTLACYHSFCKSCLRKFVKGQRKKAKGKIIEEFNCPECRTVFQLKQEQSVEEMPRNHFVSNMLEVLAIQRRPNEILCSYCDHKPPAVSRCTTCEKYLCSECLTTHGKWVGFKEHTVFTIDELTKPENQAKIRERARCKKHEKKILKSYCETCKQLVCTHCIIYEHKDGHSCQPTKKVADKKRDLLKSSSVFLNDELKEVNDILEDIDHVTQELKSNTKKVKDEISQQKQNILKVFTENLEEETKILMNEVDNKFIETHEDLLKQKADVKAYLVKVKGPFELAKNLLEKGTDEEILSFQNEIENMRKVKSERPAKRMEPIHDVNVQYKANPIYSTSNLNKMGEVVVEKNLRHPCENETWNMILPARVEACEKDLRPLPEQPAEIIPATDLTKENMENLQCYVCSGIAVITCEICEETVCRDCFSILMKKTCKDNGKHLYQTIKKIRKYKMPYTKCHGESRNLEDIPMTD